MTAPALRTGPMRHEHRDRVAAMLRATGVFREEEISVAIELFDGALGTGNWGLGTGTPSVSSVPESPVPSPRSSPPDYAVLGAFTPDESLVGYACYGPTPSTDRTWDLYWIAVDPAAQGAGAGTTLLSEVERRLSELDARMLVVETSSRSEYAATRAFYARRGYAEAARVREFYAPGDDRIIFTKRFLSRPGQGRGVVSR